MSEPRSDQREWRFYLDDMIWSIIRDDIPNLLKALHTLAGSGR